MHNIITLEDDYKNVLPFLPTSSAILSKLKTYVSLLLQGQEVKNLISNSTLNTIWSRHVLDSYQLISLSPSSLHWVDIGAGAGFPGLVIAICLSENSNAHITLIEKNKNKCSFLENVSKTLKLNVTILNNRIENQNNITLPKVDVVMARAFAPLPLLLTYCFSFLSSGSVGIFPKGKTYENELFLAKKTYDIDYSLKESMTSSESKIIVIKKIKVKK